MKIVHSLPRNSCGVIPQKLLIATNNKGKFVEIRDLLTLIEIDAIPSFDFNIQEPEETGLDFQENSLLKAKYYAKKTGLFSLADDSGLCVEALNGAPGIYSARFAIDAKTGEKNFKMAFERIFAELREKNLPQDQNPAAHFICNLSLFNPANDFEISFEGRVDGTLTFPPRGSNGFGYDSIFIKDGMRETFGEIDAKMKDRISHRAQAFEKFVNWVTVSKK